MPRWLAPNVITLLGILAIYANILTILIYVPDLISSGPSWIYFSFAFGLFFYQTMDNIDGKQARATGSSSPLGELFDHGIDSLNCCLGGLVQSVCMGLGSSQASAFITFSTCVAMYLSTWETYHTHVLYLGYVNGPTEGIIIAVITMLISGFKGVAFWNTPINSFFPPLAQFFISFIVPSTDTLNFADRPIKYLWVYVVFWAMLFLHVPVCIFNVYMYKRNQAKPALGASAGENVRNLIKQTHSLDTPLSPTFGSSSSSTGFLSNNTSSRDTSKPISIEDDNDEKFMPKKKYHQTPFGQDSFATALLQLSPLVACGAAIYFWITSPYSTIISNNHLVLFTLTISMVFGRMTTTIILAHLTRQPFPYWSAPMYPLFAGAILFRLFRWPSAAAFLTVGAPGASHNSPESIDDIQLIPSNEVHPTSVDRSYSVAVNFELIYLWIFFFYVFAYFSVYSTRVIKAITEFLGISAFTVRKPIDLMEKDL